MNYVFFDIECANCFQGRGKICSFGYVITDESFNILQKQDIVINPRSKFHLTGHGNHPGIVLAYSEKEFRSAPSFPSFYNQIRSLLQDENNLIFGFSVMSDASYIKCDCERYGKEVFDYDFIDVQRIYTDMHSLQNTPSLIKCAAEYGVTQTQDIHKSDDDALFTMLVMKGMCEQLSLSPEELIKKYPNSRCWCKNGELDTEYTAFKAMQRSNKLSKMEKLTNTRRSNWIHTDNNKKSFEKYVSKVYVQYSSESSLRGKKVCISNLYEEFHYNEMMNIVSILAKSGARYTQKPFACDIFVKYSLKSASKEFECFRLRKALRCAESNGKQIEFISFEDFLGMIDTDEQSLSVLNEDELSPIRKKTVAAT